MLRQDSLREITPRISLVATVFNERAAIADWLASIEQQTLQPDEIVIVDGGSDDGTIELLNEFAKTHPHTRVIVDRTCTKQFSRGPISRGRNRAISEARGEIIAVTDAGCRLQPQWLAEITGPFTDPEVDVVSGWYRAAPGNRLQEYLAPMFCPPLDRIDRGRFLPSSRSVAFRKSAWQAAGGYPEDSYTAEDTLFDMRLFAVARKKCFAADAIVEWHLPATWKELRRKLYAYGYGEGQQRLFVLRNLSRIGAVLLFPITLGILPLLGKRLLAIYFYFWHGLGFINGFLATYRRS
jgi:glycosyltransferase involved in cell wall biosynthesis